MAKAWQNDESHRALVRLIRSMETRKYWMGDRWTTDPGRAQAFNHSADAVRTCVERDLKNVELVFRLPQGQEDVFRFPIR